MTVSVSILIKALNEEEKIGRCLESACRAISSISGEVILIDSMSSDRTVEIAKKYPVRIIQFENRGDVGCGAAVQLGYQYAKGEYIYVLDGDMELVPDFLVYAISYLAGQKSVAGVGGRLVDTVVNTPDDKRRNEYYSKINIAVSVEHLGGGGLYKREAIESVGYLANRWLKAGEELDLGLRLKAKGWKLMRTSEVAVFHTGHKESAITMIKRLFMSDRMAAYGSLLRFAVGNPWISLALAKVWFVFVVPSIYLSVFLFSLVINTLTSIPLAITYFSVLAVLIFLLWLVVSLKKRSLLDAALAIVAWHLGSYAAMKGFLIPPKNPLEQIQASTIS